MEEGKKFWKSKLFWLGLIQTLIGFLGLLGEFLSKGDFSPFAITVLLSGVLTIIIRIWFTNQPIV